MHLVNCNVVMVGARQDRFRGRGGDSFVLSPRFSGSSATGWIDTSKLGDGHFTLATAVAVVRRRSQSSRRRGGPRHHAQSAGVAAAVADQRAPGLLDPQSARIAGRRRPGTSGFRPTCWRRESARDCSAAAPPRMRSSSSSPMADTSTTPACTSSSAVASGSSCCRRAARISAIRWTTWPMRSSACAWISACTSASPARPIHSARCGRRSSAPSSSAAGRSAPSSIRARTRRASCCTCRPRRSPA